MERTKVIVRKLPPNVAEADVRDLVNNTGIKYDWFSFVQGKTRYSSASNLYTYLSMHWLKLQHIPPYRTVKDTQDCPFCAPELHARLSVSIYDTCRTFVLEPVLVLSWPHWLEAYRVSVPVLFPGRH